MQNGERTDIKSTGKEKLVKLNNKVIKKPLTGFDSLKSNGITPIIWRQKSLDCSSKPVWLYFIISWSNLTQFCLPLVFSKLISRNFSMSGNDKTAST